MSELPGAAGLRQDEETSKRELKGWYVRIFFHILLLNYRNFELMPQDNTPAWAIYWGHRYVTEDIQAKNLMNWNFSLLERYELKLHHYAKQSLYRKQIYSNCIPTKLTKIQRIYNKLKVIEFNLKNPYFLIGQKAHFYGKVCLNSHEVNLPSV